jgi:hypothetical protein
VIKEKELSLKSSLKNRIGCKSATKPSKWRNFYYPNRIYLIPSRRKNEAENPEVKRLAS